MIKAFIHIIVASLVFLSSSGLLINSHYCQGKLVKTSFFFSFGSCCGEEALDTCTPEKESCSNEDHSTHKEGEEDEGCCKSKPSYFKLEQDQQIQLVEFKSFERLIPWNVIILAADIQLPLFNKRTLRFHNHSPPLILFDRQVRFQTFLC